MSIKLRYIIALSLIAVLVSVSAIMMRYIFNAQDNDAKVINVAGQQRMLSQRIALFVQRVSNCDSELELNVKSLNSSVDKFASNHQYLSTSSVLPSGIRSLYFGAESVDSLSKDYAESARAFIAKPQCGSPPIVFQARQTDDLLEVLNDVVNEFENDATKRVSQIKNIEMFLWIATLVVLLLEALLIFRPMERQISATLSRLATAMNRAEKAKQEAIEASKAKSEFLASMSHELRTPMNGLFGMIELAIDNPTKADTYLKKAKNAGKQLLMLINDVLDLSKIEAGKLKIENTSFDIYQIIDDAVSLQAIYCRNKGLEFYYHKETDLPDSIIGDPTRISQVLHNLLNNAIKFTDKGRVDLYVSVIIKARKHYLKCVVVDTGVGISEEHQKSIFNKFEQADQTTTRLYGGTGLGLSISAKLTQLMEGILSVESEVAKGSTFTFSLPINIDKRAIPLQSNIMLNCAIVDDLQTSREYFVHLVTLQGLKAKAYESATDFLDDKPEQYDLLILDLSMPHIDGVDTIQALLDTKSTQLPYILLVSAVLEHLDCSEQVRNAIWKTHAKPVDRRAIEKDLLELQHLTERRSNEQDKSLNSGRHILVVEDNEINAEVVKVMLENEQYEVTIAFDGQKAVDACLVQDFDLILMDLQMPVMDGLTATRKLREQYKLKTPIVALTANAFAEDRNQCFDVGMDDFISKPIDKIKLLGAVERLITVLN